MGVYAFTAKHAALPVATPAASILPGYLEGLDVATVADARMAQEVCGNTPYGDVGACDGVMGCEYWNGGGGVGLRAAGDGRGVRRSEWVRLGRVKTALRVASPAVRHRERVNALHFNEVLHLGQRDLILRRREVRMPGPHGRGALREERGAGVRVERFGGWGWGRGCGNQPLWRLR